MLLAEFDSYVAQAKVWEGRRTETLSDGYIPITCGEGIAIGLPQTSTGDRLEALSLVNEGYRLMSNDCNDDSSISEDGKQNFIRSNSGRRSTGSRFYGVYHNIARQDS